MISRWLPALLLLSVTLQWEPSAGPVDRYLVYQAQQPSRGTPGYVVATLPADATTYTVEGLTEGAAYCWRLVAMGNGYSSGYSERVCWSTDTVAPGTPTTLRLK